jgi:energy-coupling factor transporter ATP-binding protein EcfA2
MQLSRVDIRNFRSIDDLSLLFTHRCQSLLGINESGKSNILRALSLLDPLMTPSPSDLRIERHDEEQVIKGHVLFIFKFAADEVEQIFKSVSAHFCKESINEALIAENGTAITFKQWCLSRNEGIYRVNFPSTSRTFTSWATKATDQLLPNWFQNKSAESVSLTPIEGAPIVVPAKGFVYWPKDSALSVHEFEPATIQQINNILADLIGKFMSDKLPKCIFWKYADQYLLPSSIDMTTFCADPDTCIPLKSMFELAGYDVSKLAVTIAQAQALGHHRYVQILEKTAKAATDHIRSVWKDHKSIRIKLEPNSTTLSPVIVDDVVPLDMANRSDGFKRFVSFLLQISAKVRTKELKNTLILVDEPEIGLHPSGARSLMRELIEIGESNTVVYSTHSIFMIDKNEINRHLVVEKKNEVTVTWRADKSRIQDEEVLYSAMGYSIFESLKECNVIFEGWRDKEIFKVVADAMSKGSKPIKEKLSMIGMTYAEGVKDVKTLSQILQLASRPCLIISDADNAALQYKKAYLVPGAWGTWKTLRDVMPSSSALTGEDLLTKEAVIKRANKFRNAIVDLKPLTEHCWHSGEATLKGLIRWLESSGLTGKPLEEATALLKSTIFDGLKRIEVIDEAELLVQFVLDYDFTT